MTKKEKQTLKENVDMIKRRKKKTLCCVAAACMFSYVRTYMMLQLLKNFVVECSPVGRLVCDITSRPVIEFRHTRTV